MQISLQITSHPTLICDKTIFNVAIHKIFFKSLFSFQFEKRIRSEPVETNTKTADSGVEGGLEGSKSRRRVF